MAARRIKGEGALRKRKDGLWEARLTIGRDTKGNQKYKTIYGKTKAECIAKLNELKKIDFSTLSYSEASKVTYSDWLDYWFNLRKGQLAYKTALDYKRHIDNHIRPYVGHLKLDQVNDRHIEMRLNELRNPTDGSPPKSARLLQYIYFLFNATLELAVNKDLLLKNPCRKVERPRQQKSVKRVPTSEEVYRIIDHAFPKYQLFFELAWETGARRGELLALDYRSIDYKEPGIYITKSAYENEETKEVVVKTTKTKESQRKILLSHYMLNKLGGNPRRISGQIFLDENGKLFRPALISQAFTTAVKRAGFNPKEISLHSLRHAHAHALLSEKVPMEVVQQRLGHSSIDITISTYGHVSSGFQKEVPNIMDNLRRKIK